MRTPLDIGVIYIRVYNIILLDIRLMYNSCYVNRVGLRIVNVRGKQNQFAASGYNNIFRGLHLRRFFVHIILV